MKVLIKFYRFTNIYDQKFLDNETTALWIFFWNMHGRAFCFIKASILLILLKCIFVGYSDGNESFTGRLFSNDGPLNMLFRFFRYLIYSVFHKTFANKFMKKLSFQLKFQKSISRCSILRKIRMFNFVILKWRPFENKVKSWKICQFWGLFFQK